MILIGKRRLLVVCFAILAVAVVELFEGGISVAGAACIGGMAAGYCGFDMGATIAKERVKT